MWQKWRVPCGGSWDPRHDEARRILEQRGLESGQRRMTTPVPDNSPDGAKPVAGLRHYLRHLRPLSFPVVGFHMAAGFFVAHRGAVWQLGARDWGFICAGVSIWTLLLNGGTLAINTVFDRDEGDIGYLFNPPPVPRYLLGFSLVLLALGMALAPFLGWRFGITYAICLVMSLLYSVPPVRLKARAGWDLLINCSGYGMLTFYAGWAVARKPLEPRGLFACLGYLLLFICFYPLTQIYQNEEDRRRGDRTFALLLGRRWVLRLSLAMMAAAFVLFGAHAVWGGLSWRVIGLPLAFFAWCVVLIPWNLRQERYDEKRGMYRALWAWGLTDIAIVFNAVGP